MATTRNLNIPKELDASLEQIVPPYDPDKYMDHTDEQLSALEEKVHDANSGNQRQDALMEAEEPLLPETGVNHPLANLAGTHEGEAWEFILKAIARNRQAEEEDEAVEIAG